MTIQEFSGFLPAIEVPGIGPLPTYFLIISIATCVCILWLVKRAQIHFLSRNTALDIALVLLISGFIGSRLLHVLFEAPSYYWEEPTRVFEIWRGGFVWYGGVLVGGAASIAFIIYKRLPLGKWLDLSAPILALGYALGRLACLLTGCCFGAVCEFSPHFHFRYPTQGFSVVWELGVMALLLWSEKKRDVGSPRGFAWLKTPGQIFLLWVTLHSTGRIIMEYFRADDRGPMPLDLSISTWISLVLGLTAFGLMLKRGRRKSSSDIRLS